MHGIVLNSDEEKIPAYLQLLRNEDKSLFSEDELRFVDSRLDGLMLDPIFSNDYCLSGGIKFTRWDADRLNELTRPIRQKLPFFLLHRPTVHPLHYPQNAYFALRFLR